MPPKKADTYPPPKKGRNLNSGKMRAQKLFRPGFKMNFALAGHIMDPPPASKMNFAATAGDNAPLSFLRPPPGKQAKTLNKVGQLAKPFAATQPPMPLNVFEDEGEPHAAPKVLHQMDNSGASTWPETGLLQGSRKENVSNLLDSRPTTVGSRPGTVGTMESRPGTVGSRPGAVGSRPGTVGSQTGRPAFKLQKFPNNYDGGSQWPPLLSSQAPATASTASFQTMGSTSVGSTTNLYTMGSMSTLQANGSTVTLASNSGSEMDTKALQNVANVLWPHSKKRAMLTKQQLLENAQAAASGSLSMSKKLKQKQLTEGEISLANFRNFLTRKFKNPARAWHALDDDGNMNIGELEFRRACQRVGYRGNINAIWKQLDRDTSGSITLLELEPLAAAGLGKFKAWSNKVFPPNGDTRKLFALLDDNNNGQLSFKELKHACKTHGFTDDHSLKVLYQMMDQDGLGFVTIDEMIFMDRFKPPPFLLVESDSKVTQKFRQQVCNRFGGQKLRAWCCGLDKDRSMRVSWREFSQAIKNYLGPSCTEEMAAAAWRDMDSDFSGYISLKEWDEESFAAVLLFRRWCVDNFRSVRGAFAAMDVDRNGIVAQGTFLDFAAESKADLILLFRGFDFDDSGTWSVKELAFLDKWDLKAEGYDLHIARNKFQKAVNKAQNAVKMATGLKSLMASMGSDKRSPCALLVKAFHVIEPFKKWCIKTHGCMIRTFRSFDMNCSMSLHRREFEDAVAMQGCKTDAAALWRYFNRDVSGMISLLEFDCEGAIEVAKFKLWYTEAFGEEIELLFSEVGMEGQETITTERFTKACADKGFNGSLDVLFQLFQDEDPRLVSLEEMRMLNRWQVPLFIVHEADPEELRSWKSQLIEAYDDEPLRAWVQGLDVERSMYICWRDFEKAYIKLARNPGRGSVALSRERIARAWRAMDVNLDGWVSLREFDAHIFQIVRTFKKWANANYGTVKGIFDAVDDDGNGRLSYKELATVALKHVPDLEILFHGLDPKGQGVWFEKDLEFLDEWDLEFEDNIRNPVKDDAQTIQDAASSEASHMH